MTPRSYVPYAAVLAIASVASGCGGHSRSNASVAVQRCVMTWNRSPNSLGPKVASLDLTDLNATPAVLVEAKPRGECEVRIGSQGSAFVLDAFLYGPNEKPSKEIRKLEGPGKAANLPPWNAHIVGDDGALALGGL